MVPGWEGDTGLSPDEAQKKDRAQAWETNLANNVGTWGRFGVARHLGTVTVPRPHKGSVWLFTSIFLQKLF